MSWRDGCAPRPPVEPGGPAVPFDFEAADELGRRLAAVGRAGADVLAARAAAVPGLVDWTGRHRRRFDEHRRTHEAVLRAGVDAELRRLRAAWDEAAAAQTRANRRAVGPGTGSGPPR